jgi:hypothetical protein
MGGEGIARQSFLGWRSALLCNDLAAHERRPSDACALPRSRPAVSPVGTSSGTRSAARTGPARNGPPAADWGSQGEEWLPRVAGQTETRSGATLGSGGRSGGGDGAARRGFGGQPQHGQPPPSGVSLGPGAQEKLARYQRRESARAAAYRGGDRLERCGAAHRSAWRACQHRASPLTLHNICYRTGCAGIRGGGSGRAGGANSRSGLI